ncbi:SDR family NAD(P)-dependent oxidoreductase [Methylobacterium sp. SI9]|uniref:SDR family NAD(P)-dependent oxidoreductase n=1 Tax=Methylobacterium guangdongense TaxID=3138811 RepID=UPI00313CA3A8
MAGERTWLVADASDGLGRSLAEAIATAGDNIVACGRDLSPLAELANGRVVLMEFDANDPAEADRAVRLAIDRFGRLDVVVVNDAETESAITEKSVPSGTHSIAATEQAGTIDIVHSAIPVLQQQHAGRIIRIHAVSSPETEHHPAFLALAPGRRRSYEALAREMAPLGIHVSVVYPYGFQKDNSSSSKRTSGGAADQIETLRGLEQTERASPWREPDHDQQRVEAIFRLADAPSPPLRLVIVTGTYKRKKADASKPSLRER